MSKPGRRTRYNRKRAIARRLIEDTTIDAETKRCALAVLKFADSNGVIYNDALFALWQEMEGAAGPRDARGR